MTFRNLISVVFIIVFLTGCGTLQVSPAKVFPQIDGSIQSIDAENPWTLTLKDVREIGKNGEQIRSTEKKISLPAGQFVSKDHWQSNGDTLDLFIGDGFMMMTDSGSMADVGHGPQFAGIVKSINSSEMLIQEVDYDTTSHDSHAMIATNQNVIIHLVPYTKVSLNGVGQPHSSSVIHTGDAVLFVLIGPPSEYIATQITDFNSPSAAGWNLK